MEVTVRFLGPFERYSTQRELPLELPDEATVGVAMQTMGAELGEVFREEVLESLSQVRRMVLVNGSSLLAHGWDTRLADGDTISLVPPTAGG